VEQLVVDWLQAGGLLALVLLMGAEKFVPILPSYAVLALGGVAAGEGAYHPLAAVLASVTGSLLGSFGWYLIGLWVGPARVDAFVARWGRWFGMNNDRYARAAELFRRNSGWLLGVSQLVPTVRIFITFPAGVLQIPLRRIVLPTVLGVLVWNGGFVFAGYLLEESPLGDGMATVVIAGAVLLEILIFWVIYMGYRAWKRRLAVKRDADACVPGARIERPSAGRAHRS